MPLFRKITVFCLRAPTWSWSRFWPFKVFSKQCKLHTTPMRMIPYLEMKQILRHFFQRTRQKRRSCINHFKAMVQRRNAVVFPLISWWWDFLERHLEEISGFIQSTDYLTPCLCVHWFQDVSRHRMQNLAKLLARYPVTSDHTVNPQWPQSLNYQKTYICCFATKQMFCNWPKFSKQRATLVMRTDAKAKRSHQVTNSCIVSCLKKLGWQTVSRQMKSTLVSANAITAYHRETPTKKNHHRRHWNISIELLSNIMSKSSWTSKVTLTFCSWVAG